MTTKEKWENKLDTLTQRYEAAKANMIIAYENFDVELGNNLNARCESLLTSMEIVALVLDTLVD